MPEGEVHAVVEATVMRGWSGRQWTGRIAYQMRHNGGS